MRWKRQPRAPRRPGSGARRGGGRPSTHSAHRAAANGSHLTPRSVTAPAARRPQPCPPPRFTRTLRPLCAPGQPSISRSPASTAARSAQRSLLPTMSHSHKAVHESEATLNAVVKGQVLACCTNAASFADGTPTGLWCAARGGRGGWGRLGAATRAGGGPRPRARTRTFSCSCSCAARARSYLCSQQAADPGQSQLPPLFHFAGCQGWQSLQSTGRWPPARTQPCFSFSQQAVRAGRALLPLHEQGWVGGLRPAARLRSSRSFIPRASAAARAAACSR